MFATGKEVGGQSTLLELGIFFQNWLVLGKQTERLLDYLVFILRFSSSECGLCIILYICIHTK